MNHCKTYYLDNYTLIVNRLYGIICLFLLVISIILLIFTTNNANKIESELNRYLKEIKKNSISDIELKSTKKRLVNETIFAQDSLYMGMRIFGSSLSTGYSLKDIINWPNDIQKVSQKDLQNIFLSFFDLNKSVTGLLLPKDK